MGSENRQSKRFTAVNLELFLPDTNKRVGQVVDLSEGGLKALTTVKFGVGSTHKFRIAYKRNVSDQVIFNFEAVIAWVRESAPNANIYSIGLEFVKDPDIQNYIIQLMITLHDN